MTDLPKTFRVKSFGCQMNVYDGERMAELLGAQGMTAAADGEDADLVVLNTCHIREKAAEKAYSDVGRLRREDGSKPMIALAGCVAQAEGAEAQALVQMIDLVVGPQAYHRLPEMVAEAATGGRPVDTDMPAISKFGALPAPPQGRPERLPHRPGRLRQILHLLRRALHPRRRRSAGRGPTSSPRPQPWSTAERARSPCSARTSTPGATATRGLDALIRALAKIDGLERIRYTTSHPSRHDRRANRRAWRGRQADALSPPAGAVGHRFDPEGDEPQPHAPNPTSGRSRKSAPRGPISPFPATSSSASRAKPMKISPRRYPSSMRWVTLRHIRSNIAPGRALRRRRWKERWHQR